MGLASKINAATAGAPPGGYGGYPPQQQGQKPGGYPGQPQYQAYSGGPPASGPYQAYPGNQSPYTSAPLPAGYGALPYGSQAPPYPVQAGPAVQPPYSPTQYGQQPPYGQQPYAQQPYGQSQYSRPPPPPPQQGPYQPQPYGGQPSYPPAPAYGYAQQGQPGQYPPQQGGYPPQGQYGAPPSQQAGPAQVAAYKQALQATIQERNLHNFYPPNSPILDQIANRASAQVDQLCARWRIPKEIGNDIVKLALYDIILYIDDSGSMQFEENGERIDDLKLILERVAFAVTLFDEDGISIRFMNSNPPMHLLDHIKSDQQIQQLMSNTQFKGLTPMGTQLREKVIDGIILRNARAGQLRKPVLVITITDGQPAGEPQDAIFNTIKYASQELSRMPQYGPGAIAFQFAQVGNDIKAREFLSKLDSDPSVGNLIDCTSNYENEQAEMMQSQPPVDLTPELWLIKLLLGAIDSSYDRKDEKANRPPPGQQGYGAPPPGGYGAPPGQYGTPPPGQYGQPQHGYGQPPQGYGQQPGGYPPPQQGQYGRPGQGYPPQQGGYPPQQGGYPPQQGGYGAPPPPRY